jgi:hypothetical protein
LSYNLTISEYEGGREGYIKPDPTALDSAPKGEKQILKNPRQQHYTGLLHSISFKSKPTLLVLPISKFSERPTTRRAIKLPRVMRTVITLTLLSTFLFLPTTLTHPLAAAGPHDFTPASVNQKREAEAGGYRGGAIQRREPEPEVYRGAGGQKREPEAEAHRGGALQRREPEAEAYRYSGSQKREPEAEAYRYSGSQKREPEAEAHRFSSSQKREPEAEAYRYSGSQKRDPEAEAYRYSGSQKREPEA